MSDAPPSTADAVTTKLAMSESEVEFHASACSQSEGNLDIVEPSAPSRSDSGSSMDESVESSSDESSEVEPSLSEPSREEQEQAVVDSDLLPTTSITACDLEHPLHGRLPAPVTDNTNPVELRDDQTHKKERLHREPSAESDAYEPPEPGTGTDPFDPAYSPRFSPAPPGPVEDAAASLHPLDGPYPDEALTHTPQASIQEPRRNTQRTVLGV